MPPQFQSQFNPSNDASVPPVNSPISQKPPRGHSFLIVIMVLLILTGVFGVWYFSNPSLEEDMKITATINKPTSTEGKFCGGIAPGAFPCPTGYVCKLDGAYPDAGGHCVVPDGTGTLAGQVTIGPNCPVEQIDNPCITSPEAYASREFSVMQNGKVITTFHADMTGNYIVSLAPSTYIVTSAKTGIGYMSKDLPVTVTIKAGEAAILNIDVDTGIR
ncbi:MAG: hypothetical protein A3G46_01910 [Candidatus Zambryskibacteria bacterium RIFCSPLOWO2_12_FULL_39_16]|uniref:Carboxypeptidase regulatory-like domain-containing protein n=1 Tax=Candidatus Zambryskibacteria bacterium RIFCSPLOWO2_12_FULL_39_16 TaxID=1802775 RepID=A0A1G2USI3_9BACT|nr:MAG: hypothetical protein A3G46_01910 [Candidatus Zambryskibacteria bacterium RIFCSPLOWO2_12_FULL_39_16]